MPMPHPRRRAVLAALAVAALGTALLPAPQARAATIAVPPVRTIAVGTDFVVPLLASDGTVYAYSASASEVQVWAPSSDGYPTSTKTFTGVDSNGFPSLGPAGFAWADGSAGEVNVLDPSQADGAAVPTRTIGGPLTLLDDPTAVAWTANGSLWVADQGSAGIELLRFAPGANGDVAPVQVITGPRTGLNGSPVFGGVVALAAMPGNGVAASPAGLDPKVLVFTTAQTGDTAPARRIQVPTPSPSWLSQGVATDSQGRIYIGSGDINGDEFGRLDVFAPTANGNAAPLLTLAGPQQRLKVPIAPSVAPNGGVALLDATFFLLSGGGPVSAEVKVFRPLFTKPGAPRSLTVAKRGPSVAMTWKAASNPAGTPVTYRVVVKKGAKTVLSTSTRGLSASAKRSALPKGKLKVTVTAVNAGGTGPAASKTFTN